MLKISKFHHNVLAFETGTVAKKVLIIHKYCLFIEGLNMFMVSMKYEHSKFNPYKKICTIFLICLNQTWLIILKIL